jgi:hypothetical protein
MLRTCVVACLAATVTDLHQHITGGHGNLGSFLATFREICTHVPARIFVGARWLIRGVINSN